MANECHSLIESNWKQKDDIVIKVIVLGKDHIFIDKNQGICYNSLGFGWFFAEVVLDNFSFLYQLLTPLLNPSLLILVQFDIVNYLKFSQTTANARQWKTYSLLKSINIFVHNDSHWNDFISSLEPFGEVVDDGLGGREESVSTFFLQHESSSVVHSDFDLSVVELFDFFSDGLLFVA